MLQICLTSCSPHHSTTLESGWMSALRWHINIHSSIALGVAVGLCVSILFLNERYSYIHKSSDVYKSTKN